MAELDNVFSSSSSEETSGPLDNENVDIEWLDFDYINNCTDLNRLKSIYNVLKSGKEGRYPEVCLFALFDSLFLFLFYSLCI